MLCGSPPIPLSPGLRKRAEGTVAALHPPAATPWGPPEHPAWYGSRGPRPDHSGVCIVRLPSGPAPFQFGIFMSKHSWLGPGRHRQLSGDSVPKPHAQHSLVSLGFDVSEGPVSLRRGPYHLALGPSEPQLRAPQDPNRPFPSVLWVCF